MANHYRKTRSLYVKRLREKDDCPFCDPTSTVDRIYENSSLFVMPNLTKYDLWEMVDVEDHLLVIPKRHVLSLAELNENERCDLLDVISAYEAKGYSVYARGVGNIKRSVDHQHTHLIKNIGKKARFMIFISRPYFVLKR